MEKNLDERDKLSYFKLYIVIITIKESFLNIFYTTNSFLHLKLI